MNIKPPEFRSIPLDECGEATGAVVAIDVLRAFTTAAFAFGAGAARIIPVATVDQARSLREQIPGALLMGEEHGLPIEDFDLSNSPSALVGRNLAGRTLIQRTSAGTQGLVHSRRAEELLAASFCCAGATARYLARRQPKTVSFVVTGLFADGYGDEDAACADFIRALVQGAHPDPAPYLDRVAGSLVAAKFLNPAQPDFLRSDLDYCLQLDRFDLAMVVRREGDLLIMRAQK